MNNLLDIKVIIDSEFKRLIMPESNEKIQKIKEMTLNDGCQNSFPIWNNILLGQYSAFKICTEHGIAFKTISVNAGSRAEAMEWVCLNQLKRSDLTLKMRIYLIGKLYRAKKQYYGVGNKPILEEVSSAYGKATQTILKYASYSRSFDALAEYDPGFAQDVLSEKVTASYESIYKLIANTRKCGDAELINHYIKGKYMKNKDVHAKIKIMPEYDPNAELAGLKLTIPSWIGSIKRVAASADFKKSEKEVKLQLISELKQLNSATNEILKLTEENCNE